MPRTDGNEGPYAGGGDFPTRFELCLYRDTVLYGLDGPGHNPHRVP